MTQARIVVGAAGTGAGKTLTSAALCAVLRARGLRVRAFKSGPDYIDARLYASVLGEPARNLDLWLDGEDGVLRHVAACASDADAVVIEGMMGLFDGDDEGRTSTASLARALDAAVLTVLDTWTASQSAAAVALGLRAYDPRVRHVGAILNRVGSPSHAAAVAAACARAGVDVLAAIPRRAAYAFPERTLGLERAAFERRAEAIQRFAEELERGLDVDGLLARAAAPALAASALLPARAPLARVAIAEDEAFWFTYPETLDALRAAGADVVRFSPLHDRSLPPDCDALWIGGGYPEDHAAQLEANRSLRTDVRDAVAAGVPTYAECGGLMYLAQSLRTAYGSFSMAGALGGATSIAEPRLHIGYREARAAADSPLDPRDAAIRGYEFHYATPLLEGDAPAYLHAGGEDGAVRARCIAAFMHRHFLPGDPAIGRFVAAAASRA